ncbi:membrane protein [Kocuria sp. SM24M-10]|nr:membrane protein [Kocuria sp. SM24M-10]
MLFDGWEPVARIVVVGTLAYTALVVLLRVSGKRTLSRMNSFDFVITVAIGATFGRVLTTRSVPLVEAVTAFALLITLQYVVTSLQIRSKRFSRLVTAEPALLLYQGRVLHDALRAERLTEKELEGAVRKHGMGSLQEAEAVVLEADGRLSVIGPDNAGDGAILPHDPPD